MTVRTHGPSLPHVDPMALVGLLWTRASLEAHRGWSAERLARHQAHALAALRAHAYARSPFYRDFHRGLEGAPLAELPVLTKANLMAHFDELVTDRRIRLAKIERQLETPRGPDRYLGRYRVQLTAGTTGRRGIFLADDHEWSIITAAYSRIYAWAGWTIGVARPQRLAVVASTDRAHQSFLVSETLRNPFVPTLTLSAADPIERTVEALNRFRPRTLVGYATVLGELAEEQRAGRLAIGPEAVFSVSEVLTDELASAVRIAWGQDPFDVYGATETGPIASSCARRHLHVYADQVIAEAVDDDNRPVPAGVTGAKLLVTVLFSRTQPLIRYELTDRVRFAAEPALDLGPFSAVIDEVEGRAEEVLHLPGRTATVRVHPDLFHAVLDTVDGPWQVIAHPDGLEVLVAAPADGIEQRLRHALAAAGALPRPLVVRRVGAIPRTPLGKAPLVRSEVAPMSRGRPA